MANDPKSDSKDEEDISRRLHLMASQISVPSRMPEVRRAARSIRRRRWVAAGVAGLAACGLTGLLVSTRPSRELTTEVRTSAKARTTVESANAAGREASRRRTAGGRSSVAPENNQSSRSTSSPRATTSTEGSDDPGSGTQQRPAAATDSVPPGHQAEARPDLNSQNVPQAPKGSAPSLDTSVPDPNFKLGLLTGDEIDPVLAKQLDVRNGLGVVVGDQYYYLLVGSPLGHPSDGMVLIVSSSADGRGSGEHFSSAYLRGHGSISAEGRSGTAVAVMAADGTSHVLDPSTATIR